MYKNSREILLSNSDGECLLKSQPDLFSEAILKLANRESVVCVSVCPVAHHHIVIKLVISKVCSQLIL